MATEIQNIKVSQLTESTEVTDSNCVVMADDVTGEEVEAMNLKGNGLTSTQEQQLNVAYAHSQSAHVQSSDIPTRISVLENDRPFVTLTEMTTAINDAQLGGGNNDIDLSIYQPIQDDTLTVNSKIIPAAINELKGIIDTLLNRIIELENQQGATIGVTGVSLNHNTLALNVGDTNTLTATISPSNATNQSVIWSTNNGSVATVSNGVVTAVSAGQATIRVTTEDGGYSDSCIVTVDTSAVVADSYITDENENRLMAEDGFYLITD